MHLVVEPFQEAVMKMLPYFVENAVLTQNEINRICIFSPSICGEADSRVPQGKSRAWAVWLGLLYFPDDDLVCQTAHVEYMEHVFHPAVRLSQQRPDKSNQSVKPMQQKEDR
ncbi:hypothetical protein CCH79_00007005 [Gambusia affinis]|uniref:Uncharacterized protein n=1 Tax=Gambusia affinis TaxID=33528 RepID=A0A315VK57_GAMAF|nr:hypothetical protein CCH79_00007005 [Gambusia affinis]